MKLTGALMRFEIVTSRTNWSSALAQNSPGSVSRSSLTTTRMS